MLSTPVLCDSNLSLYLRALAISDNGALIFSYAVSVARSHSTFVNDLFMVMLHVKLDITNVQSVLHVVKYSSRCKTVFPSLQSESSIRFLPTLSRLTATDDPLAIVVVVLAIVVNFSLESGKLSRIFWLMRRRKIHTAFKMLIVSSIS